MAIVRATLLPKQAEFVLSTADVAIYDGGVGAGKTIASVSIAIKLAMEHPGIRILMCAPTYGMLRDITIFEFRQRCPDILIEKKSFDGPYPSAMFRPKNGRRSVFLFRAFDDAGKPKGLTVGAALIEEVTEMKQKVLGEIMRRVRQRGMPNYIRFATNADSKTHYVYKDFIYPAEEGLLPKERLHRIHTTSYDNFLLPEITLRNLEILKLTRPGEYLRSVMGEWGDFDENNIGVFEKIQAFTSPYLVAFLDTSFSDSTVSDRTALAIVGFVPQQGRENRYWPIEFTGESWQKSVTHPEVIDGVIRFLDRFKPIEVCIESQLGDSTQVFIDGFRAAEKRLGVSPKNHWTVLHQTKNKHERIMLEVAGNRDRMKVLESTSPDFLNMVVSYTKKADHDDEPDALAGAVNLWRTSKNLRDYMMMAEKKKA